MKLTVRSLLFVSFVSVILAMVLVACGQSGEEANDQQQLANRVVATDESVANETPAPLPTGVSEATTASQVMPETVDFGGLLATLGNYELVVDTTFTGQDAAGSPVSFQWRGNKTVLANPSAQRLDLTTSGDNQGDDIRSVTILRSGGQSHLYLPSVGCIALARDDSAGEVDLPLDPAELLKGWSFAAPASEEGVANESAATEYHFDESMLERFSAGPWSVEGITQVAQDANLAVNVALTISGKGDLPGEGRELNGTYRIIIDVMELEEGVGVEIPQDCQQAVPYPVTEDAFAMSTIDDLLAYKSLMALVEVVDFYLAQMPAAGWQLVGEPEVFDDLAFFTYEREGRQILITIESDPQTGVVTVLVSP